MKLEDDMEYKRNSGKFKSLLMVAVMAALVMGLCMPGSAAAAPQVWLSIPGNSGGSDTAIAQKYAVVFYNDSASSITVTQVDITHDNSGGSVGWGGTPSVTSPASTWSVANSYTIRWTGSVSVPAYSAQEFRCQVVGSGTAGASGGTLCNVSASVTATGGPYSSSSHSTYQSSSSRASKLNGYLAASTANNNASPVYLLTNSGSTFAAGATVNFIYQVWTNGNGAGARYIVADCGSGSEVNITLPAGWSQPTNFTVPSMFNTPTTSGSVGTGWTIHMVQNAATASFQTEQFYNFQFSSNAPTDRATDSVEPVIISYGAITSTDYVESGATSGCGATGSFYTPVSVKTGAAVYVAAGTQNDTIVGALTSTGATDSTISVQAAFTGDDNNDNSLSPGGDIQINNGGWTNLTNTAKGAGVYTASASGLLPGTSYSFQADFTDADGVSGTDPATASLSTTYHGLGVGTVTLGAVTDVSVVVNAPVDNASDDDNNATVQYQYNDGGGWTNFGSAVSAKSNQSMNITGLSPNTNYDFRAVWSDSTNVYNMSTKAALGSPYNSNTANQTTAYDGTTVGALTRTAITAYTIDLSAAFTGDNDTDNSVVFEWDTVPTSGWSTSGVGSPVRGAGAWTVQITGLTELTDYQFRATFTDADGLYGTNPATLTDTTPSACNAVVNDCMDCHAMPPSIGDHEVGAHLGDASRHACAVCHFNYNSMANVTSVTKWTTGHTNDFLDVYTSANVNGGIRGGGYKGYRNASSLWDGGTVNSNNVCANTYCHGSTSPVWGVGSAGCGSCHLIGPAGGKHGVHSQGYVGLGNASDSGNYNFGCYKCHPAAQHSQGPADGYQSAYVGFDNLTAPMNPGGSYTKGGSNFTDAGFSWTNGTCSSTYCHSNGAGTPVTSPNWNNGSATCTSCHKGLKSDAPNHMVSGKHAEHINNALPNLASITCDECHSGTTTTGNTITNKANHVNGTPDVALGTGSWSGTNCSSTACHTNGRETSPTDLNPAWGGAAIGCNGCHGTDDYYTDINGRPDYNNASYPNSHYVTGHLTTAAHCIRCHNNTVDSAGAIKAGSSHLNGSRDVNLVTGSWDGGTNKCSNTGSGCHLNATTPAWGVVATCYDCHVDTGAIGTEVDNYTWGSNMATINELEWQNAGHGRQTASGNYPYTGNAPANFGDCTTNCHTYGVAHNSGTNPFRLTNADTVVLCTGCHSTSTTNHHSEAVVDANMPTANAVWTFTPKCVDCHDPHGDNGGVTTNQYNAAMIHSAVNSSGSNTYGVPAGTTNVDFPTGFPGGSFVWGSFVDSTSPYNGLCHVCHDASDNVANFNKTTYNASHNPGLACNGCHTHDIGFAGAGGSCLDCHGTGGMGTTAGRNNIETEFGRNSHHINATWANIDPISCAVCHAEGNTDGTVNSTNHTMAANQPINLKVYGTYPTVGSTVSYTKGTSAASVLTPFCLGCHKAANASATPFSASGDSGTPSQYDTASGGTGAGSIDERYSDSNTTTFSKYDPNMYNVVPQLTKAYSPHGNSANNQRGVTLSGNWANDNGNLDVECFDCHNSHGSDAGSGGTSTSYSSSVGGYGAGILKTTATYTPAAGSSSIDGDTTINWSASADLCWDCHLGDDGTAPKTYSTFNNNAKIQGYYDAGRWRSADIWAPSHQYKTSNATVGSNGHGGQKGGHFGRSSNLTNQPTNSISGRCTVCHDPHGVKSTGGRVDAAYDVPALKGAWLTSPYKEDRAPTGSTSLRPTANTYEYRWMSRKGFQPSRMSPAYNYNSPPLVGAGYGAGDPATNWGKAGTGGYGYFIDDNTFGTDDTHDSNGDGTITDITARSSWTPDTGMVDTTANTIIQTQAQFAGLCLTSGCHTQAQLVAVSSNNGTTTVEAHKAVKGWAASSTSDIFRNVDAANHMMEWRTTGSTGNSMQCTLTTGTVSYQLPAGYRWSVNPGTRVARSGNMSTNPPGSGGQQTIGNVQNNFHNFPCSKCHTAHTSKLPRLMKTNCIDVGTSNANPKHADGSPASEGTYNYPACATGATAIGPNRLYTMTCHNTRRQNTSSGGGWNIITGW